MALLQISAYAKINLYLAVGGVRRDGFHDVKTVMRRTSVCDELTVETAEGGTGRIALTVLGCEDLPTGADNLAYRAAECYLRKAGVSDSINITLKKNIPVGAGLGGGSADAAAVLRALDRIYGIASGDELWEMAASLGSDVPFCLYGRTALCEGRGEILTVVNDEREMHLVIAMKDRTVSTPDAFSRLDETRQKNGEAPSEEKLTSLLRFLSGEGEMPTELYNSFENALGEIEDDVLCLKRKMKEHGACLTLMSGSGPSVFGIFPDADSAERCVTALCDEGVRAYYSK